MKRLRLSPSQRVIAWRLVEPRLVSMDELIVALWGDRPDGGPEWARGAVGSCLFNIRQKLAPCGVEIVVFYGQGWSVRPEQRALLLDLLVDEIARNTPDRLRARRAAGPTAGLSHGAGGGP